ncbi:MAG TPA: hypothetical protein VN577_13615 [Terriglobales bacterium]|nr:hypothetical protein [Terriglobales bacterium]
MKKVLIAIMLVCILSVVALATDRTVNFRTPTVVNGQKLPAGEYTLRYDVKGDTADVQILKGKKVVATSKASVVDVKDGVRYDGVVRSPNADGSESLKEIQVAKDKKVIRLETGDTAVGK